jgi:hypothetical protein
MLRRFGFGSAPAAPGNTPANTTQEKANKDLINALHQVANVRLRNAINAATAAANAKGAEKSKRIAELEAALNAAKPVAAAATAMAPNKSVESTTQTAEAGAVNAAARNAAAFANFNQRIANGDNTGKLTQIEVNIQKYANNHGIPFNRNNVKQRLNKINKKRTNMRTSQ